MNSKLSETFDLPDYKEPSQDDIASALEEAKEIEKTLKDINGFEAHDVEMDEISEKAIAAHSDLLELGMNVETRIAGEIFNSSATMLKIALDARNSKVDKKLRLIKLQLDKMRLDKMTSEEKDNTVNGGELAMNRNELLAHIQKQTKNS